MRTIVLGVALACGLVGVAQAADFVVVSSTDPAIPRGQELSAGQMVPLGVGKTLVVVSPAGQVTRLTGTAAATVLPRRQQLASVNEDRIAVLKMLVAPPRVRRTGPSLDKVCPEADLNQFDGIVTVAQVDGCLTRARAAFEAYVEKAVGPVAP
jgi:hypothetical protein